MVGEHGVVALYGIATAGQRSLSARRQTCDLQMNNTQPSTMSRFAAAIVTEPL